MAEDTLRKQLLFNERLFEAEKRAQSAEARLALVQALPEKWRSYIERYSPAARDLGEMSIEGEIDGIEICINELESALHPENKTFTASLTLTPKTSEKDESTVGTKDRLASHDGVKPIYFGMGGDNPTPIPAECIVETKGKLYQGLVAGDEYFLVEPRLDEAKAEFPILQIFVGDTPKETDHLQQYYLDVLNWFKKWFGE